MQKSKLQIKVQNWPIKKLGEIVVLNYGKGISRHDRKSDGKYPIYGANGILDYTDKYLIDGKAVIVGRKGSAGEVTRVSGKFWPSDVTYFVLGNKQIDIDYLFHLFKSLNLQRFAVGVKPGINRNRIYELEIPLPPLEEQKKIVAKLERVLAKISEAKKLRIIARENADNLLPAELHKIFSTQQHSNILKNVGMSSSGKKSWEEKELGDETILKMTSGGTPSRSNNDFYNGNIPWLKSGELEDNVDIVDSEEKISEDAIKKSSAKVFPKGTVLFAMYGATAGKLGMLGIDASTNQAVAGMIPVAEKLNNKFLYYFLFKQREEIISQAWGGAQPNLSQTIIKKFKIPLPPLAEQKRIVKHLDSLSQKFQKLQEYQKSTQSDLLTFEQAILHKAFL